MTPLAAATVLKLALACQNVVAPTTVLKIATHESGLFPDRKHQNVDGSTDVGLMQINSANFPLLHMTWEDALDPCKSIAAAAALWRGYSLYNTGSPTRGIENGYALAVQGVHVGGSGSHSEQQVVLAPVRIRAALDDVPDNSPALVPGEDAGINDRPAALDTEK